MYCPKCGGGLTSIGYAGNFKCAKEDGGCGLVVTAGRIESCTPKSKPISLRRAAQLRKLRRAQLKKEDGFVKGLTDSPLDMLAIPQPQQPVPANVIRREW